MSLTMTEAVRQTFLADLHVGVMGIADGDTDAAWLAEIGLPVAVSNAMPAAREAATLHIGHHADEAVADFLEEYSTAGT